jgi:hypothetical protein
MIECHVVLVVWCVRMFAYFSFELLIYSQPSPCSSIDNQRVFWRRKATSDYVMQRSIHHTDRNFGKKKSFFNKNQMALVAVVTGDTVAVSSEDPNGNHECCCCSHKCKLMANAAAQCQ